ncbi:MAG: nucleoside monophosphate kinase [Nanoarchaeota archaeon]
MKIILLGPPGSGKGTISECLEEKFGFYHLSTGEIFRAEISKKTPLGVKADSYISKGNLVPDKVTIDIVKSVVKGKENYLLDGFPRTLPQAEGTSGLGIDAVISLDVSEATVIERLSGRRGCPGCQAIYHVKYSPPKKAGLCDKCGGKLIQREDDKPVTIKERLRVYNQQTAPLLGYYEKKGLLHHLDASPPPDVVCKNAGDLVGRLMKKK